MLKSLMEMSKKSRRFQPPISNIALEIYTVVDLRLSYGIKNLQRFAMKFFIFILIPRVRMSLHRSLTSDFGTILKSLYNFSQSYIVENI
jgi:hypothetical protein